MPTVSIRPLVLAAGTTAAVALLACAPATAHATPDLPIAVEACTVPTAAVGRDPPASVYHVEIDSSATPDGSRATAHVVALRK